MENSPLLKDLPGNSPVWQELLPRLQSLHPTFEQKKNAEALQLFQEVENCSYAKEEDRQEAQILSASFGPSSFSRTPFL